MKQFRGTYAVITTPFTADEKLNEEALRGNIDWFIEQGVYGIVCTGSTGEFESLSDDERKKVVRITVDQVNGRTPVLAGSMAPSTWETIQWAKYAEDTGADGAMIVHPFYCPPTEEELYQHYKMVAEAIDIPIMIYNNPWCSGSDMTPELLAKCAEVDNISYVKESTADITRVHKIIRLAGEKITVFCGWDDLALESFVLGAKGWVCASANIIPRMAKDLFELAVEKGDIPKAKELYYKILPLCSFLEEGKFVQKAKAAQNMLPMTTGGITRRPRLPLTQEEKAKLEKILRELGILT